jgi:thiamine-phosphate pyrophosphorylase
MTSSTPSPSISPRLYIISPAQIEIDAFKDIFARTLDAGDVASFQLRLKDKDGNPASDDHILRACEQLIPIAHAKDVAFLLNDRPDLVVQTGADGCHIGQDDMDCKSARKLLGDRSIIGVTCHNSRHLAMIAGEATADYVAFGAFFNSQTKDPKYRAEPEILTWWQEIAEIPCVAIGGITLENASIVIDAGADFIAVSQGIWGHNEGAPAAVIGFNKLLQKTT